MGPLLSLRLKTWWFCALPQARLYFTRPSRLCEEISGALSANSTSYFRKYVFEEDVTICRYVVTCVRKHCVASGQIGKSINAIAVAAYCQRWTIICPLSVT